MDTETDAIEQHAIKFAAEQFIATLAPALAVLPERIRLPVLDWTVVELVARQVGTLATVEHLRLLADICEAHEIDKLGNRAPGEAH